jgi:hypothetical protein
MKQVILSLAVVLLIASCTSTGNLGMVSRSTADPGSLLTSPQPYKEIGPAKGKACRYFLLGIIPWGDSTLKTAVDNALAESGGDALINLSVSSNLYGFVPIYNVFCFTCTTVEGIAIKYETSTGSI